MPIVRTRKGNVLSVPIGSRAKKYFQYIANDLTQLNSDVIRAFKKVYPVDAKPELPEVLSGEVEFYAHVVVPWGIKMKLWEKVGSVPFNGKVEAYFRDSDDYGTPQIKYSEKWFVWRIKEKTQHVGKLTGVLSAAEIGIVVTPTDIVDRMRTGKYDFVYPRIKQ
jgi:hypothetical protein